MTWKLLGCASDNYLHFPTHKCFFFFRFDTWEFLLHFLRCQKMLFMGMKKISQNYSLTNSNHENVHQSWNWWWTMIYMISRMNTTKPSPSSWNKHMVCWYLPSAWPKQAQNNVLKSESSRHRTIRIISSKPININRIITDLHQRRSEYWFNTRNFLSKLRRSDPMARRSSAMRGIKRANGNCGTPVSL